LKKLILPAFLIYAKGKRKGPENKHLC